mgnify:CR=1 FL=1
MLGLFYYSDQFNSLHIRYIRLNERGKFCEKISKQQVVLR